MGMWVALAAHDEVLCGAIEAHGGWLFKHTGDGVCRVGGPSADERTGRYTHQDTSGSPTKRRRLCRRCFVNCSAPVAELWQ
jgi:hypothetical protein